jgi:hypothetical protein
MCGFGATHSSGIHWDNGRILWDYLIKVFLFLFYSLFYLQQHIPYLIPETISKYLQKAKGAYL